MDSAIRQTFVTPIGNISATANASQAAQVADKYLNDSLLLNKLTERAYELLQEDMRIQRERVNNYGYPRW
ncbi:MULTISPECIES: hypothetical protein [Cyanophyceae]|uniref:hypothetical protein n=1 Tax=Cyanophyceae TaxID=3028117 RepID=UPI00232F78D4|nr:MULTISPECIES: hypothetical protein [Cyanophyceae]MDB9356119.1 hypothetical protein [Nodularia spumigena CS-587/03]MDB9341363.1 hypothetical protein [Nodularia spumigena CS-589/07]MDB9399150.1 hypothetical protein [Microcystis aeruginosa CS-567/02-A1]MDB9500215.1 hypothetical protein [Nodularia spumigena CS-336/02]MDB9533481.1 hypothetical protein [Nodularia spumigena CS-1038]